MIVLHTVKCLLYKQNVEVISRKCRWADSGDHYMSPDFATTLHLVHVVHAAVWYIIHYTLYM